MTAERTLDKDEITDKASSSNPIPASNSSAGSVDVDAKYAQQWRYFNSVEDGSRISKGWFKVVAAEYLNYDKFNDDEDAWYYADGSGNLYAGEFKTIKGKKYAFRDDGRMIDGLKFIKEEGNGLDVIADDDATYNFDNEDDFDENSLALEALGYKCYYFGNGDDGAMKTGAQSIKDNNDETYKFYFETKGNKGKGIVGNKSGKLYYHGQLVTADDYRYELAELTLKDKDGNDVVYTFIVNQNGAIQHSKTEYKEDGDVLIDARGTYNETTKKYENIPNFGGTNELKDSLTAEEAAKLNNLNTNTIDVNSYVPETSWN